MVLDKNDIEKSKSFFLGNCLKLGWKLMKQKLSKIEGKSGNIEEFSTLTNKNDIHSLSIGGFDGLHFAHQRLLSHLCSNGAILSIQSIYQCLTPKHHKTKHTKLPIFIMT